MKHGALATELKRLTEELVRAHEQLDAAFNTDPPGDILRDEQLTRYLREAHRIIEIGRRIKEIKEELAPHTPAQ